MASNKYLAAALCSVVASVVGMPCGVIEAAEKEPIGHKIDNAQVIERVQLVGVIAGAKAKSGIAVIKDALTGKTYAIKTGDILPGVPHIKLQSVQRELAVFNADGKEFKIRLAMSGFAQEADDDEDLSADLGKSNGPGLFEKWYGSKIGVGPDLVDGQNDSSLKLPPTKFEEVNSASSTANGKNALNDEATKLREDNDGPVADYLNRITRSQSGVRARVVESVHAESADSRSQASFIEEPRNEAEE